MDDVYDSLFEGDEETEADVMNQIYDEIGLECANAVYYCCPLNTHSLGPLSFDAC